MYSSGDPTPAYATVHIAMECYIILFLSISHRDPANRSVTEKEIRQW